MKSEPSDIQQSVWPELPALSEWQNTLETVHLWTQIVGKIRLEHMPWINHSWHTTLYVSSRGLTTSFIPHPAGGFEMAFNFHEHTLEIFVVNGKGLSFSLRDMSVADFYNQTMDSLRQLGLATAIYPKPVEIADPITAFPEDTKHASYEAEMVRRFWRALTQVHRVFTRFRAGFIGKVSPVHFYWGSFDLAVTRFSGRKAPEHPGGAPNCPDWVMQEAYSRELSSAGFWPGTGFGEAAFYAYAYPEPDGFRTAAVEHGARYDEDLGEYILPYNAVQRASRPDEVLLSFLERTYKAAADNDHWNNLEIQKQR